MNQKSFYDLLTRYHEGNCTEAEKLWVDKWYHNLNSKSFEDLSDAALDEMQQSVWQNINPDATKLVKTATIKRLWPKFAIAASFIVAFLIGGLYWANKNNAENAFMSDNEGLELISKTNDTNRPIIVSLSDESKITLDPKANIIYPKDFATDKRTVYLKGNAFFSVSKNPKRPFYVYNRTLVVRVLGTSFFVKSSVNQQPSQVSVRTGKVQVNENENCSLFRLSDKRVAKPILLKPNQKGIYTDHNLSKTLVEQPIPLAVAYNVPNTVSYNFKEKSLKEIFSTLSEAYGIDILTSQQDILNYTFTGDLSNKGLYEQLDLICGSISGKYKIKGTSIMVSNTN